MKKIKMIVLDAVLDKAENRHEGTLVKVNETDRFYDVAYNDKRIRYDLLKNEILCDTLHRIKIDLEDPKLIDKIRFWVFLSFTDNRLEMMSYHKDIIEEMI